MPKPGEFVTLRENSPDHWYGYFEPAPVCFEKELSAPPLTQAPSKSQPQKTIQEQIEAINAQKPDLNRDGLSDRFELAENDHQYLLKLFRGVKTQRSVGCAAGISIIDGVGLKPEGDVVETFEKARGTLQNIQYEDGKLVVQGSGLWKGFSTFQWKAKECSKLAEDILREEGGCRR